jgi:hypothetical protein
VPWPGTRRWVYPEKYRLKRRQIYAHELKPPATHDTPMTSMEQGETASVFVQPNLPAIHEPRCDTTHHGTCTSAGGKRRVMPPQSGSSSPPEFCGCRIGESLSPISQKSLPIQVDEKSENPDRSGPTLSRK